MDDSEDDFVTWVTARQGGLLRFAYLLTGDPHAAEDLVQTALAKAYLRWATVRTQGSRGAWLRRIIVNEHVSAWRRPWRRHELASTPYVDLAADAVGDGGPEAFDRHLWSIVCALPPRQRAAVVLRYYEELTERETAEILGCSVGTVKSQTHRALAALRVKLEEVSA